MKKTIILGIMIILSVTAATVLSTTLTVVSFGVNGDTKPIYTACWLYTGEDYSSDSFYLHIDRDSGTFNGWFTATNGQRYDVIGTFIITGNDISGTWEIDHVKGWLSGNIGV